MMAGRSMTLSQAPSAGLVVSYENAGANWWVWWTPATSGPSQPGSWSSQSTVAAEADGLATEPGVGVELGLGPGLPTPVDPGRRLWPITATITTASAAAASLIVGF